MRMSYALWFAALSAVGCSSPPTQVITGRIAPGFPMTVTTVKIKSSIVRSFDGGNADIATAPVAADGSFRIEVAALEGLHLHLIGDGQTRVVFPRQAGTIDSSFAIRGTGADFDLGMIHYVGSAATTTFVFKQAPGGTGGEMECEDDHDANGAMCVDDDDDNHNTCGQNDDEGDDGEENDDGEGEHGDNDGDHHNDDGDHADSDDGPEMGDAVAEHNFPADGCSDDDDDDDEGDDD